MGNKRFLESTACLIPLVKNPITFIRLWEKWCFPISVWCGFISEPLSSSQWSALGANQSCRMMRWADQLDGLLPFDGIPLVFCRFQSFLLPQIHIFLDETPWEYWLSFNVPLLIYFSWVPSLIQQPAWAPGPRAAGPAVPRTPHRPHLWRPRLSEAPYEESQPEPGGPSAASTHRHLPHEHRCVFRNPLPVHRGWDSLGT